MIKVLFISQLYPNRYDPMYGLFVQKHAQAVSLYNEVKVLYVYPDENINTFQIEEKSHLNLSELIVYYPCPTKKTLSKVTKTINYIRAYWKGYKQISKEGFFPDIVHANFLTRTGFIAYLFKLWKGIPYVVTEHWSRYLSVRNSYNGVIRKLTTRLVVKNANAVLPVSENLKNAMLVHNLHNSNYKVVNNVVPDFFYQDFSIENRTKKRIIHVSCFDEQSKNICGILRATLALSQKRQDFELIIVGSGIDFEMVTAYSDSLNFPKDIVLFLGEKKPEEVAYWMKNSDFFVLFSIYENSPVVISESLVCGKPVLSSNVGGIPEHVNKSNGLLVEPRDELALLEKMNFLLDHFQEFDSIKIKKIAKEKFSYKSVGKTLNDIYNQAIK
jgi:glycosyltransferase involved in cell wall biosynthesis